MARMSVKKFGGFGRIVSSAVFCALLIMGPSGANAAYLLQPGDTLEFTLVGSPELRQKIVIAVSYTHLTLPTTPYV